MSTQTEPDQYLEVNGARLRWQLAGRGPALVLLHGWALDLAYWDPLTALLVPHFTVLRFDRCGFGLSTGMPDIRRNVADLRTLLDAAAIPRAVLIGMSQGARLALHFALQIPARTRGLVLDGAPALESESELPLHQYRQLLQTQQPGALQANILRHPLMQLTVADAHAQRLLEHIVARYRGSDLQQQVVRGGAPDLDTIAAPTLILNGSLDSAPRRAAGRTLQAAIPNAQCIELAGAGHLAALDDPKAYAEAIMAFCHALPP